MIIELFGLPASGKSTYARFLEQSGAIRVREFSRNSLMAENILFFMRYPLVTLRLAYALRYAPHGLLYFSFVNLFLVHNAKWMRARRLQKSGRIAVIDQGHHQNLLSLFASVPSLSMLRSYARILPKPDLLITCEPGLEARRERLGMRGMQPRSDIGMKESERLAEVSEKVFPEALSIFEELGVRTLHLTGSFPTLADITAPVLSYATSARMPTEKAHGVSIAHMCASFSEKGMRTDLVIPRRINTITESIYSYYSVPNNFSVRTIPSVDFIGSGLTHSFFFFLQRVLFVRALFRMRLARGIVYSREPEVIWSFARTHTAVYEAHDWPRGVKGRMLALLVRRAALVVCNSEGTASVAQSYGLRHVLIAPNGFDPVPFSHVESKNNARNRLGIRQDSLVSMYVGALDARKGVRTLFESAAHAPEVSVVVIGGSAEEVRYLSGKYPTVQFLGFRPYKEIANNLVAADVLALPNSTLSDESARFTSPIKLFAYMASGVPIVACDVPAVREILNEHNSLLVPPDDPVAFARGVQTLLRDMKQARVLAQTAQSEANAYTWTARAERILKFIRDTRGGY